MKYDVIVIGGGPGGYYAAECSAKKGMKTLVLERENLGGTCLNCGCIPTKAWLYEAKTAVHARKESACITGCDATVYHKAVLERKDRIVKLLVSGVGSTLKSCGVEVVYAEARRLWRKEEGFEVEASTRQNEICSYEGKNVILACGSETVLPPIPGLHEGLQAGTVVTSKEFLDLNEMPQHLVIVGGGVIGLELATYAAAAGAQVTVVEGLSRIGASLDAGMAGILQKNLQKQGIRFVLDAMVEEIHPDGVRYRKDGTMETVHAEMTLMAIGRKPKVTLDGLTELGVEMDCGAVRTDEQMRTNIPGLYAVGDINGRSMLAHTAYREAAVAVNTIAGKQDRMRYHAVPGVLYTDPEAASVGETAESAAKKAIPVWSVTVPMMLSGRYVAENLHGDGACTLIFRKDTRNLVGAHLIGSYASELITLAAMMMEMELRPEDICELVIPHPSVGEVYREAAYRAMQENVL